MRHSAPLWFLIAVAAVAISMPLTAGETLLVGKQPSWDIRGEEPNPSGSSNKGEALETPNQARRRLGLPIEASYAPVDCGDLEETPNHRRHRLGLSPESPLLADLAQVP